MKKKSANHFDAKLLPEDGRVIVQGELNFQTVPLLRKLGEEIILQRPKIEFDFKEVTGSNSAGLTLLIKWLKLGQKENKEIVFTHLPEQLFDIAKVSGLVKLLPIKNNE